MWSLYMTILILGFISGAYMITCPEEEDISPCQCQEKSGYIMVWCSFFKKKQDLETLQQALNSLSGKHYVHLHLEYFNSTISSDLFSGIGIKKLNFHACRVDSLTKDDQPGFLGLENHLEYLRISESSSVLEKLNLGHLKKLKTIDLSGNDIRELGDDWLSNEPPSLETLTIWESNIIKIGSNAFSHLNSLKTLSLADNRFGPIKRSMFPTRADRLKTLGIMSDITISSEVQTTADTRQAAMTFDYGCRNNALTDLPVDIFSSMPAIENIHLSRNGITTLDERTWSPVWQQLKRVDLYDNKILCDERLNWIHNSNKRPKISGLCSGPEEFEMVSLEDFFKNPKPVKLF